MTVLYIVLLVIEAICALLLIGVILMQRSKSQGLGIALGGQMGEALFGTQMGNVLTRVTIVLGIVFLVNTTLLAMLNSRRHTASVTEGYRPPVSAPVSAPDQPAPLPLPQPTPLPLPEPTAPALPLPTAPATADNEPPAALPAP